MGAFKITKVLMKSLFNKPATLMYPVVPRQWQERTRGHIEMDESKCILCGICAKRCPADAITVDRAGRTWSIERMACIQCSACADNCPKKCLTMKPEYTTPGAEKVHDTYSIPEAPKPAPKPAAAPAGGEAAAAAPAEDGLHCDTANCVFCGLCARTCPMGALTVDRAEKKWEVDRDTCVSCGACVDKCPKKCLSL